MTIVKLPLRNLVRHPGHTAALTVLVALLSMSLLGGSIIVLSLLSCGRDAGILRENIRPVFARL